MKHHFANSSEPLKEGAAIRGMCRKCNNGDLPKRFVYIVCEGQEAKTEDVA